MKILISGSSGFVGSRVLHQWQGRAELFTFPRGSLAAADESAIRRFAETVQPDVILHLAALSDTGYCQQHPEESQRANVELPIWMAKAAQDTGAKLISFSSDQVYAGVTQPGPCLKRLPLLPRQHLWSSTSWRPRSGSLRSARRRCFCGTPWSVRSAR